MRPMLNVSRGIGRGLCCFSLLDLRASCVGLSHGFLTFITADCTKLGNGTVTADVCCFNLSDLRALCVGLSHSFLTFVSADCTKVGDGTISADVTHNGIRFPCKVRKDHPGVYRITFKPRGPGVYKIWINYDDMPVKGQSRDF